MYTKFFIFIFLLNTIVSPLNSKERYSLNIPDKMQIELKNKDYNRYMKMGMRAYADGSDSKLSNIKKKYKKWIEADIVLDSKKNKSVKAKVRIMGDWKDHLRLPFTSLKVKILDDDYYGVRRFNLFLPHTRKGINEVYWTLLLKYIGFPSFYTKMVDVNLNGLKYEAIFQEDASKEFLERNSFRETVIIKDNDFDFYLNKKSKKLYGKLFSHSIIIDNGNFLKDLNNKVATSIASEAIALHSAKDFEDRILNWDLYYKINIKYALHGQDKVNRKFIFIPHKKAFIPLYYDGMVQFPIGKTECKSKSNSKIFENFSDYYKKLSKEDLSPMKKCVFHEIYSLYEKQKKNKSNIKKYKTNINYEFIPKYTKIKNKILNYLENNNVVKKIEKKGMLYSFLKDNKYYLCELNIEEEVINSCQHLSHKEYNDLITKSGKFSTFKNYKFFPINLGSFDKSLEIIKLLDDPLLQEQTFIFDKSNLYALDLNTKNEKKYNLVFNNHNAKLIITGDILNNKFNIKGNTSIPAKKLSRFDHNLLTGCVTFLNTEFNGGFILAENMMCEDAINIINSKGKINEIKIFNSSYDSLDIDYSNISIEKMLINKAGNDCADFSFGNYKILESLVDNCSDKAFSFGEKSEGFVKNSLIKNSLNGVVSKDDSIVKIEDSKAMEIKKFCLAAYNKKPEFEGGTIIKSNFVCTEQNKEYKDLKSNIQ